MSHLTERRVYFAALVFCALCVAYFYVLDRVLFSSARFSPIFRVLLTSYDVKAAWLVLGICLLAALWNRPIPVLRLVDFIGEHPCGLALVSAAAIGAAARFSVRACVNAKVIARLLFPGNAKAPWCSDMDH